MIEAFFSGLVQVLSWPCIGFMLIGMVAGFLVGILPGIGGATTLAIMLPFTYTMNPVTALAFLLGMHSVVATTGDITSILFGIPGEPASASVVLDGHALAKKGEAGRSLGAALFSSLVGAVLGALTILIAVPILIPLSMLIGSPEFLMLGILGISYISSLSGRSITKGLIMGGLGLLCSVVGVDPWTTTYRYTFGQIYLWEGFPLVPFIVGIFGIPEIVELAVRGTSIAETTTDVSKLRGVAEGVKDTFRYWKSTLRGSIIGVIVGIIPGMGGSVANWMAYGYEVQASRDKSRFGKGAIEGVLGPGAANNAKEGGALIPTLAFGIPGSGTMAILLGAFLILGLRPGPDMLTKHLDITFSMMWTLIIANIICVAVSLIFLKHLARLTQVRSSFIVPLVLLLIFIGSITANNSMGDLMITLFFGFLGCLMVLFNWPRPPLIIGVVLGEILEKNLFISISRYGVDWLARPGVIIIFLLIIGGFFYGARLGKKQ